MTDTFYADLMQEPQVLEAERFDLPGGVYWPTLAYALPFAHRPLTLDVTVPKSEGPHPVVVYIHGGGWFLGSPKYASKTMRKLDVRDRLIAAGFAVARISYRLSGEAKWPVPLHDCKAAVRYLRRRAKVFGLDVGRFAVMGESAGGHLAMMLALTGDNPGWEGSVGITRGSSAVKAAVNWYGVSDLAALSATELPPDDPLMAAGGPPAVLLVGSSDATDLRDASPITHVHDAAPPFLHQHGDRDRMVDLSQSREFHEALRAVGVVSELNIVPGADHCFWGAGEAPILDRTLAFLADHL